ncbi:MAG: AAA family ATPase [Spirochaetes bacterium]|nr:AAA family ATPase [Spirochaetota bacterium]
MPIDRVEIKDFRVFKDEFTADFCLGVNVFIGGNATGKTTLLKALYRRAKMPAFHSSIPGSPGKVIFDRGENLIQYDGVTTTLDITKGIRPVYIPEKDILEHAKGLLTFIEQKQTGFGPEYKDVLIAAQDVPTQEQSETQKSIGQKIVAIIGGNVHWDKGDGSFYTLKTDGSRIPFADEASGYKKFGFLGLLVSSGQLESGSILFWDEPENSLNPELVPALVDILLELSRNGVQIFIATHSEILASYFAVNRKKDDSVMFYSLYKDGDQIKTNIGDRFDLLEPNNLTAEPVKLYKKEIERGLGGNG